MTKRLILDVDTGVDDAMAICMALSSPGAELAACTTVFGNVDVATATRNTLQILEMCHRPEIPVAMGAGRSLLEPYVNKVEHIHGKSGLGYVSLPEPNGCAVDEHAADLIIRMAKENPGEITLVPVAPMTNVALAISKAPEIAKMLREIVIMGGTIFHPGINGVSPPMVDANIHNDPEAAHIVLNSGANITLVGMDVTMVTLLNSERMNAIAEKSGAAGRKLMDIARFYVEAYDAQRIAPVGCGMHDPLAVAVAIDASLVTKEQMNVTVELNGTWTRGQVVADRRAKPRLNAEVDVCTGVDVEEFLDRFEAAIVNI